MQNDEGAFRRLFSKEYRHYLEIGVAIPVFYEFTGMIVISVFSPVLFRMVGFSSQRAILGSVINSATNLASTLLSSVVMDRTGRRFLFIVGGLGMMLCEVSMHPGGDLLLASREECVLPWTSPTMSIDLTFPNLHVHEP